MPTRKSTIRFDGAAVKEHSIRADDLICSLRGFSTLINESNHILNGQDVEAHLIITANVEQNCFELGFNINHKVIEAIAASLFTKSIVEISQILSWIGLIIPSYVSVKVSSFYDLLKKLKGKDISTQISPGNDRNETIKITINGDNNIVAAPVILNAPRGVVELYNDPSVRKAGADVLLPLKNRDYSTIGFYDQGNEVTSINNQEANEIIDNVSLLAVDSDMKTISKITTIVKLKKPDMPGKSKWTFIWKNHSINASIKHVSWLTDYQSGKIMIQAGAMLEVEMIESTVTNSSSNLSHDDYEIIKVLRILSKNENAQLPFPDD